MLSRMSASLRERLVAALQLHQSGERAAAERAYREILRDFPDQPDTLHLLGVLALQSERWADAVELLRAAIAQRPAFADAHSNLGVALQQSGDFVAAVESFAAAVRHNPNHVEAQSNLGNMLRCVGRLDESVAACRRALELKPDFANAHNHLGLSLAALGQTDAAVAAFRRTLELQPRHVEALRNLASELHGQRRFDEAVELLRRALQLRPDDPSSLALLGTALHAQGDLAAATQILMQAAESPTVSASTLTAYGNVLAAQERHAEALGVFERAAALSPDYAKAFFNWATSLRALGHHQDALVVSQRALSLAPDSPEGLTNHGLLLSTLGQLDESIAYHRRAIALSPHLAEAWNNLSAPLFESCEYETGLAAVDYALALDSVSPAAHLNRAMFLLSDGNYPEGWREYEYRMRATPQNHGRRKSDRPRWDGSPLDGRRLLLFAEQGLGDTLQFIRYAHLLASRGERVTVAVQPRLAGLLSNLPTVIEFVPWDRPFPEHDLYSELLSVCRHFTHSIEQIPAPIPYLGARPDLVEYWRDELARYPGFRVGIAWQGSNSQSDYRRVPLEHFGHLAQIPGVRLFSLQTDGAEELQACRDRVPVVDLADRLDKEHGAFQDTAAVMMNMDLVVSSDTSVPHVAGALGRPVWLALRYAAEWRWLRYREDTPWYPTMRLFRQRTRGDWDEVLRRMAAELAAQMSSSSKPASP